MSVHRTPEEEQRQDEDRVRIRAVLDHAVEDFASWILADRSGLDEDACELWISNVWNGLRDNLGDEDRLQAILLLLEERAFCRYLQIQSGLERAS